MRTLVRYLFFFGVLVGLAFAVVSVEIGGETLYRRYRMHRIWPMAMRWLDTSRTPDKPRPKPDRRAKDRVALLRRATRAASPETATAQPKKKTRVDSPASAKQKKALDELVTSRVGRRE